MEINTAMETVFAGLFFAANRLQVQVDQYLAPDGLTCRQWLLLAVIHKSPQGLASMGEAARALCTSHQNIKQMAALLEKAGWIEWVKRPGDRRFLYMKQTGRCEVYWQKREADDRLYLQNLFGGFQPEEVRLMADFLMRFYLGLGGILPGATDREGEKR